MIVIKRERFCYSSAFFWNGEKKHTRGETAMVFYDETKKSIQNQATDGKFKQRIYFTVSTMRMESICTR